MMNENKINCFRMLIKYIYIFSVVTLNVIYGIFVFIFNQEYFIDAISFGNGL